MALLANKSVVRSDISLESKKEKSLRPRARLKENYFSNTKTSVTSIVVEQGCFQTELRIAGNSNELIYFRKQLRIAGYSNELIYFRKVTSRIYNTKLLHIKPIFYSRNSRSNIYEALKVKVR